MRVTVAVDQIRPMRVCCTIPIGHTTQTSVVYSVPAVGPVVHDVRAGPPPFSVVPVHLPFSVAQAGPRVVVAVPAHQA